MNYSCIVASAMRYPPNIKFDYLPVVCLICALSLSYDLLLSYLSSPIYQLQYNTFTNKHLTCVTKKPTTSYGNSLKRLMVSRSNELW